MEQSVRTLVACVLLGANAASQDHDRSAVIRGQHARFTLASAVPASNAVFVFGFGGAGHGLCLPPDNALCLSLLAPLFIAPPVIVDAAGTAQLDLIVPGTAPLIVLGTQVVVLDPTATFAISNPVFGAIAPISALGDEFDGDRDGLDPSWQRHNAGNLSLALRRGELLMAPRTSGPAVAWHDDGEGPLVYKLVTGDFDVSAKIHCYDPRSPSSPPPPDSRLGGLMIRDPIGPAGDHDWVHLTIGSGIGAIPTAIEDKSTVDSASDLFLHTVSTTRAELRMTRRGTFVQCYWRPVGGTRWTVLRGFDRPDLPATVQVGLSISARPAGASPLVEQIVDWIRFAP